MGIVYQIPHTARYIPAALTFKADFDATTGVYNFDNLNNRNVLIEEMDLNTIYIIDRISIGGDIPGEVYTDSINTLPSLNFERSMNLQSNNKNNLQVYQRPITIPTFADDRSIIAWVHSDKKGDNLIANFKGILNQVSQTVGNQEIRIFCALDLYAIDATIFGNRYRDILSEQTGEQVRGRL